MAKRMVLLRELDEIDHGQLPPELAWAESIAAHLGAKLDAECVEVWREAEGLGAVWER